MLAVDDYRTLMEAFEHDRAERAGDQPAEVAT
jgi:hypothetical protein